MNLGVRIVERFLKSFVLPRKRKRRLDVLIVIPKELQRNIQLLQPPGVEALDLGVGPVVEAVLALVEPN